MCHIRKRFIQSETSIPEDYCNFDISAYQKIKKTPRSLYNRQHDEGGNYMAETEFLAWNRHFNKKK